MASRDEAQDVVECDMCQQPVSFFCKRCGANLCETCLPKHVRTKSKNGHDVVDYLSKNDDDTCHCSLHPENDCSAFCKTCDVPICLLCVSIKHKPHEISELSDKIEELLNAITQENDRLQSSKQDLERILEHTTKVLSSISSFYKQRKDEVTARGKEWHKLVEENVKKFHQELDDMREEHEDILQKQKKEYEDTIKKLNEINGKATRLQKSKNVKEMQILTPVIKGQKTMQDFLQYSFPMFYKDEIDENHLQTNFGYIEKMQMKKYPLSRNEFTEKELLGKRTADAPTIISVIKTGFPASEKDNRSGVFNMAYAGNNKVWMGGASTELKLFDVEGYLHHIVSITTVGMYFGMYKNQVMFTDTRRHTVKMVTDADTVMTMFTTRKWEPYGVTSSASGDVLVCLFNYGQSKVVRYSSAGTVLQEIQFDSQCRPLYGKATCITENVNGDIIVSDERTYAVIAVDRQGVFRYLYSGRDGNLYGSVTTDPVSHVIVTDVEGHMIHILDRDGQFLRCIIPEGGIKCLGYIVPKRGLKHPRAVCILDNGEMMVGESETGNAVRIKYLED